MNRILFVLKYREQGWGSTGSELSSGLRNSVTFLVDMLNECGIEAKVVQVIDNNKIDREISIYRPTHVILEAYWVVPTKLDVLMPLWPKVKFAVRIHSEMPFLSLEGMSADWTYGYLSRGVEIMCNSPRALADMTTIAYSYDPSYGDLVTYAPNFYPSGPKPYEARPIGDVVKIGSFGAIRPLKSQFLQAVSSLAFAAYLNKPLQFHINSTRIEGSGSPILANLRGLFSHTQKATLVEHDWVEHADFIHLIREMDFVLAVSFSETFCICAADATHEGVCVVASSEVPWIGRYAHADPTDGADITANLIKATQQLGHAYDNRLNWQWQDLFDYGQKTMRHWEQRFA